MKCYVFECLSVAIIRDDAYKSGDGGALSEGVRVVCPVCVRTMCVHMYTVHTVPTNVCTIFVCVALRVYVR